MIVPFVPTRGLARAVLITSPLWLLPAAIAAPWATAIPLIALGVLALACLADAALIPGRRSLVVERTLPLAIGAGDTVQGHYIIRARWPLQLRGDLYDTLPRAVSAQRGQGEMFHVKHREEFGEKFGEKFADEYGEKPNAMFHVKHQSVIPFSVTARLRGEYQLGRVVLRITGPLGLMARTINFPMDDRVTIIPSIANLHRYQLLALQFRLRELGARTLRRRGVGTNFTGLRDYVPGDDPRHIDWKATARRLRPITREFSIEQGQTVMLVIDAGRLMTQLAGALPRFEYALSSALILANVAVQSGDSVGLLLFDDEIRAYVPPGRGPAAIRAIRDALIPAQATVTEPDYAAAFRTLATRHRRRSLLVIFTDVIDDRSSRSLIAHTARGARTHLPLVVALRNEAVVAAALPATHTTTDSLYESVAAEELLSARDEALERMRRAGVSVVDVKPEAMTAAVVNRYLELKGRGAI
jgi:uncharacterized protein (DUF58 family)